MAKIYITVFILFFAATISAQTTVIIDAAADNTIFQELTGNSNGAGVNFFAGNTAPTNARRGLIRFNLASAGIPAGAVISSASLALNMNKSVSGAAVNIAIHKLLSNWGEGASNAGSPGGQGVTAMINDATWLCSFSA